MHPNIPELLKHGKSDFLLWEICLCVLLWGGTALPRMSGRTVLLLDIFANVWFDVD